MFTLAYTYREGKSQIFEWRLGNIWIRFEYMQSDCR